MWKSTRKKTITIFTEKSTFFREISVLTKELISRKIFENDFVFHTVKEKSTFTKKKLLKSWFHGNFSVWSRFIVFFHTLLWLRKLLHQKFRETNVFWRKIILDTLNKSFVRYFDGKMLSVIKFRWFDEKNAIWYPQCGNPQIFVSQFLLQIFEKFPWKQRTKGVI